MTARLLLIGMPLTIGLGMLVGWVLCGGLDPWAVALVAAILAPTDAALAAELIRDTRIPARVRRILNVESGLNDGLVTPVVAFFLAATVSVVSTDGSNVAHAARALGVGVGVGHSGRSCPTRS